MPNPGLETFYVHILALCTEARALNLFHHVANPLVTAMFVDRFPLGQRDFHRDRGHGRSFEHDRKRELYRVTNAAANVAQAGQQVSPPKKETFAPKLNPEARPFHSNAPAAKCDFPN